MYSASIQNSNDWVLLLTEDESIYQIIDIQGLNPPKAQLNTTTIVGMDGARFNSSRLETRNLVLTVKINGDAERNRLSLYNYFRTKEWCKFFYKNGTLDVFIEGYVDSVECGIFTNSEMAQISIICPYPYFRSVREIINDISNTLGLFTFPFYINLDEPIPFSDYEANRVSNVYNSSQSVTGAIIQINVLDDVDKIEVRNTTNGEGIVVEYDFTAEDEVIINTNFGEKGVTLTREGVVYNLFAHVARNSVFPQLEAGSNLFSFLVDNGVNNDFVKIRVKHHNAYRGV